MNAITVIEAGPSLTLPPDLACTDWLAIGADLMRKDRETKWQAADWYAYGRARAKTDTVFAEQMALALPDMLEDPRKLDAIARVAEVFPADERSLGLSFDHYAVLASLPHGEARKLLAKAAEKKTGAREIKYEAMHAQMSLAPRQPADEDSQCTSLIHLYNRMPRTVRVEFAQMVAEAEGEEIEP
ncbi:MULTISPECIES: hypothetical protein [unclassified Novosphingobium]|uniref:hypothetical protein n=1 Tax=unclassified Novosphingobium TaxID=2644732 RepID=UPI00135AE253|nr:MULTISPECIES: hypothetical protein [unclassified Novosphingobium]